MQFVHCICGEWDSASFLHLIVQVPSDRATEDVLRKNFAQCIQNAGFVSWQLVSGAQEISVTLQRHLHWNRVEKMSHDSGSGWIRVYPQEVAAYGDVVAEVESFVRASEKKPL